MRITRIKIENFRSIKSIEVDLSETTVFVGPNNAGKTAILDALRIALTRRWGQRGTGFSEYDVHLPDDTADPKASRGVCIEVRLEELEPGEWSEDLGADLGGIVQRDLDTNRRSIALQVKCSWSSETDAFEPSWEFLGANRRPLAGPSARRANLERFWRYLRVFYLDALRNANDEFSPRSSQFWTRLLRDMHIPVDLESHALQVLDKLNDKLLKADPRLAKIAETLSGATQIAQRDRDGALNLRMVPLKTWDLLSRAEVVLQNEPNLPWLPLRRHGQGVQSLSVIFLFHAFVDHLLRELYEPGSVPVLALEEPETHLHPQAVRTLWHSVNALPGQKVITTHSPYFVQQIPLRDLRIVRLTENGTEVRSLPTNFSATVPSFDGLQDVVDNSAGLLTYDKSSSALTVHGTLDTKTYRNLATRFGRDERRTELESLLKGLQDQSSQYIDDDDLRSLDTYAQRMRGEIFFAQRWLIVEGQSDYLVFHAFARVLGYDLDQHGVSVIDAQNNGKPEVFASLARAFGVPWLAVFDRDDDGEKYIGAIKKRGFLPEEIDLRCRTHTAGDLEEELLAAGFGPELRNVLSASGFQAVTAMNDDALLAWMGGHKTTYAAQFAAYVSGHPDSAQRTPDAIRDAINQLRGLN